MPEVSLDQWKAYTDRQPETHLLQTGEWGELKASFGWEPVRLICENSGIQVLFRSLPLGLKAAYIPKLAPDLIRNAPSLLWQEIARLCRSKRAVFLKIEPDAWETGEDQDRAAVSPGLTLERSVFNIQPPRTIVVDLLGTEDDVLGRMKQKCRYNIRLAEKKSVTVRPWEDISGFHELIRVTGGRDGFGVHAEAYYRKAYELFHAAGNCELLVAEYQAVPLAALMVFRRGRRAWYLYGASNDVERNRMPTYLLQWAAIKWARQRGCEQYDLWGVPDVAESMLEASFESRQDGLWGVYRFKRGFGGEVKRAAQAMDAVFNPVLYRMYLWRMAGRESA